MPDDHAQNVTMSKGGLYSLATQGARDVINKAIPRVLSAVGDLHLTGRFTMADIGCADAGTSLDMIRSVLGYIRENHAHCQSTVIYSDQPANDFNSLIRIVHGQTQFDDWLSQFENAYPLISGSSFYRQCVPDNSLDFAFSATAMHWLSIKPCNISNHVHMVGARGKEKAIFARHARKDWETILAHRARELKPGGRMVLVNFCRDEQGRYLGNTGGVNMFDTFNAIWQEFADQNIISGAEYEAMTLPQYYHDRESFCAPLQDTTSECHKMGLRLEDIETAVVGCPFAADFSRHRDAKKFADRLIPTVRSWSQSIFRAALADSRSEEEKDAIIEACYQAYHDRVTQAPRGHGMDYVHAYMTIRREG